MLKCDVNQSSKSSYISEKLQYHNHVDNTNTDLYKFFWLWGSWVGGGSGDWRGSRRGSKHRKVKLW